MTETVAAMRRCSLFLLLCFAGLAQQGCDPTAVPPEPADQLPAQRIVTLSPHLTELVFTAGAGERLVGAVDFSDFPSAARDLPRIGDAFRVDYEALAALRPDLILAWRSGNPVAVQQRLRTLGYRVVALEPDSIEDVAEHLREIGRLAGTEATAEPAAAEFEFRLDAYRRAYASLASVSVFYQVSQTPLVTVSDRHVIGQALSLCGGRNVFGGLSELVPSVTEEAVISASPQVIIASDSAGNRSARDLMTVWMKWPSIPAVANSHLFVVNADVLSRASTRLIVGIHQLCQAIDVVRNASPGPAAREFPDRPLRDSATVR